MMEEEKDKLRKGAEQEETGTYLTDGWSGMCRDYPGYRQCYSEDMASQQRVNSVTISGKKEVFR